MGELQSWPSVAAASGRDGGDYHHHSPPLFSLLYSTEPNPRPEEIRAESWLRAEEATREILWCIQPTVVSDQRRRAVVDYMQSLLRAQLGCEVFPFGSVPLKTYLPDGDIDLTALCYPNTEDDLSNDVHSVLFIEEQNKEAEFEIKDVQSIHAEVKLVKCIAQNIVVDISFNQTGGLRTLCFLEMIDRKIGKNHLFKRSIILIKDWCYYESRILGAHHGLISTYALETLVLHVFHLFHKSLNGPLAVLYRFLDYYSKFDWDNYCVSLNGPVPISSLPELVVEPPETNVNDLLFTKEFIRECLEQLSVSKRGIESNFRVFPQKNLNIVDPLKQNNNLGRSVSKGNFYRIRSAFSFGARNLGRILLLPAEHISGEVSRFFTNTLERHGSRERPDVQNLPPSSKYKKSDHNGVESASPFLKIENSNKERLISGSPTRNSNEALAEGIKNVQISDLDKEHCKKMQVDKHLLSQHLDTHWLNRCTNEKLNDLREGDGISDMRLSGDAKDLASTGFSDPRNVDESFKTSPSGKDNHASDLSFHSENGCNEIVDDIDSRVNSLRNIVSNGRAVDEEISCEAEPSSSTSWFRKNAGFAFNSSIHLTSTSSQRSYMLEDSSFAEDPNEEKVNGRSPRSGGLSDLTGDYQIYINNLQFARDLEDFTPSSYFVQFHYSLPSHNQNKHSWNGFQQHSIYTNISANGLVPGVPYSPNGSYFNPSMISGTYGTKDFPRTRGTGTYFPKTNSRSYRERQSSGRGKNQIANQFPRSRDSGHTETLHDRSLLEAGNDEPSLQLQAPKFSGNDRGRPSLWDVPQSSHSAFTGASSSNDFAYPFEGKLEFGSLGPISLGVPSPKGGSNSLSVSSSGQGSGSVIPSSTEKRPSTSLNHDRPTQTYRLKDEGDFPPLG